MHCIATSLVFWVYTLIQETIDYIVKKDFGLDNSDCVESDSVTKQWFEDLKEDFIRILLSNFSIFSLRFKFFS